MKRFVHRLRFSLDHRWTPAHASEYIDGELSVDGRARLERHVRDCLECRELLRGLNVVIGTLGTLRDDRGAPIAGSILASVRRGLDETPRTGA